MILAGGLSTRLYPLTKTVPKPLVPVLGEPNIAHVMRYLRSHGITAIATNVFYFSDDVHRALGDGSRWGVRLEYLNESALSGSAGAVKQMQSFLDSDPFVVIGCDDLTDLDLGAVVAFHHSRSAIATIGLVERDDVAEYGVVVLDERAKIVGFQEKPAPGTERSRLVNTGVYVFSPAIFERIPPGEVYDFGKQVFPKLQQDGAPFYGFHAKGAYWCDIGTISEYRRVTNDLLRGRFALPETNPEWKAPDAHIAADASVRGPVWIGSGARIGPRAAIIGPSAIGENVLVAAGARVERSIVWANAIIEEDASVRDSIVGASYRVGTGCEIVDAISAREE
jgi:NDP-sugar pyrophosphorylase family protein